jgi:hypothetical protein
MEDASDHLVHDVFPAVTVPPGVFSRPRRVRDSPRARPALASRSSTSSRAGLHLERAGLPGLRAELAFRDSQGLPRRALLFGGKSERT